MRYIIILLAIAVQLVSSDQQSSLSSACVDFSQKLYQKIALDKLNVIYSPYSIHSALTMTSLGARGVTLSEMRDTLNISSLGDSVHGVYKDYILQLSSLTDGNIRPGSAVYVRPGNTVEPKFMGDTLQYYFARAGNIDASVFGGPQKPMNDYIAAQTNDMVRDAVSPSLISASTQLLLFNTLYFNSTWEKPFDPLLTKYQDFKQSDGSVTQVQMMNDKRVINMKRNIYKSVDIAELPFKGGRFSLYVALIHKTSGMINMEELLTQPVIVQELFTGLKAEEVDLAIPKFKMESTFKLKDTLRSLGLYFSLSSPADFRGIFPNKGPMYISDVVHKAVIDVRETGAVASAATTVSMNKSIFLTSTSFIADRPFVYFLRDKLTGQILFQGKFSG